MPRNRKAYIQNLSRTLMAAILLVCVGAASGQALPTGKTERQVFFLHLTKPPQEKEPDSKYYAAFGWLDHDGIVHLAIARPDAKLKAEPQRFHLGQYPTLFHWAYRADNFLAKPNAPDLLTEAGSLGRFRALVRKGEGGRMEGKEFSLNLTPIPLSPAADDLREVIEKLDKISWETQLSKAQSVELLGDDKTPKWTLIIWGDTVLLRQSTPPSANDPAAGPTTLQERLASLASLLLQSVPTSAAAPRRGPVQVLTGDLENCGLSDWGSRLPRIASDNPASLQERTKLLSRLTNQQAVELNCAEDDQDCRIVNPSFRPVDVPVSVSTGKAGDSIPLQPCQAAVIQREPGEVKLSLKNSKLAIEPTGPSSLENPPLTKTDQEGLRYLVRVAKPPGFLIEHWRELLMLLLVVVVVGIVLSVVLGSPPRREGSGSSPQRLRPYPDEESPVDINPKTAETVPPPTREIPTTFSVDTSVGIHPELAELLVRLRDVSHPALRFIWSQFPADLQRDLEDQPELEVLPKEVQSRLVESINEVLSSEKGSDHWRSFRERFTSLLGPGNAEEIDRDPALILQGLDPTFDSKQIQSVEEAVAKFRMVARLKPFNEHFEAYRRPIIDYEDHLGGLLDFWRRWQATKALVKALNRCLGHFIPKETLREFLASEEAELVLRLWGHYTKDSRILSRFFLERAFGGIVEKRVSSAVKVFLRDFCKKPTLHADQIKDGAKLLCEIKADSKRPDSPRVCLLIWEHFQSRFDDAPQYPRWRPLPTRLEDRILDALRSPIERPLLALLPASLLLGPESERLLLSEDLDSLGKGGSGTSIAHSPPPFEQTYAQQRIRELTKELEQWRTLKPWAQTPSDLHRHFESQESQIANLETARGRLRQELDARDQWWRDALRSFLRRLPDPIEAELPSSSAEILSHLGEEAQRQQERHLEQASTVKKLRQLIADLWKRINEHIFARVYGKTPSSPSGAPVPEPPLPALEEGLELDNIVSWLKDSASVQRVSLASQALRTLIPPLQQLREEGWSRYLEGTRLEPEDLAQRLTVSTEPLPGKLRETVSAAARDFQKRLPKESGPDFGGKVPADVERQLLREFFEWFFESERIKLLSDLKRLEQVIEVYFNGPETRALHEEGEPFRARFRDFCLDFEKAGIRTPDLRFLAVPPPDFPCQVETAGEAFFARNARLTELIVKRIREAGKPESTVIDINRWGHVCTWDEQLSATTKFWSNSGIPHFQMLQEE